MTGRLRYARLSAAVLAVISSTAALHADNLVWDPGMTGAGTSDGSGTWDNSTLEWYSATAGADVAFNSATPDSVTFGSLTTSSAVATPDLVALGTNITVGNVTFNLAANGATYDVDDQGDGNETLTLAGNITKTTATGNIQMQLVNPIALTAGVHTVSLADSPGDPAELTIFSGFSGAGGLTLDNSVSNAANTAYGTLALLSDSSYAGATNINDGRLVIATGNGVSTGQVNIGSLGTLSIGGAGYKPNGNLTIGNAITITRNTYTGGNFANNPDALLAANSGPANTYTFTGPISIDSTDARIGAFTSNIVISSSLVAGPDVAAGAAVADFDGDFAGFITLSGDNTAFGTAGNTIQLINGVELNVSSEANLGGASSKLNLSGGTIHPTGSLLTSGFMTNFGLHNLTGAAINTGVDIDSGNTFTVNGLSGVAIGTRGLGTINFNGTNTFTGVPYYDAGMVNINGSTSLGGFHLRSSTLNINSGATLTTTGSFSDIGSDAPDNGTLNVNNGGTLALGNYDFNVSDNANTTGTLNVAAGGAVTAGGTTYIGKSAGGIGTLNMTGGTYNSPGLFFVGENNGTGTLNQSGGAITLTRNANFTFVIGDGRQQTVVATTGSAATETGVYKLSGGSLTSAGEIYVGEGRDIVSGITNTGTGSWNQTAGTVNFSDWFVVGRDNGFGNVNITGGTFTKTGTVGADSGGNIDIGDSTNAAGTPDTFSLSNGAVATENAGEFWVGNGAPAVANVGSSSPTNPTLDAATSLTVNNWLAVGRNGTGTLNLAEGSVTQATAQFLDIGGDGNGKGTVNMTGGTLRSFQTIIGENGTSAGILNISGGVATLSTNGTPVALALQGTATGTINLNGGTLIVPSIQANNGSIGSDNGTAGTGAGTVNFNGGTLEPSVSSTNLIGAKVHSVVSTNGAIINPNGFTATVNTALTHDTTLAGADGGLTVANASTTTPGGTITLTGVETYTGPTAVTGTANLAIASTGSIVTTTLNSTTAIANAGKITESGGGSIDSITGAGTLNITAGTLNLTDPTLGTVSSQAAINLTSTGKLNIGAGAIQVATGQYATLVSEYTAGTLFSTNQQANTASRIIGIVDNGTNTIAKYTAIGDVNLDGKFSIADVAQINGANNFGGAVGTATYSTGDVNYDGRFTIADVAKINSAGTFGSGVISNVSTISPAVVGQTNGTNTIDLKYDPTTGNLTVTPNSLSYGVIQMTASASLFTIGSGTTPEYYESDTGFDFGFGVLTGTQSSTVVLAGVIDKGLSLSTLLQDITINSDSQGASPSQITFSSTGAVPEPASLSVIGLAAGAMLRRRRRSR